MKRLAILAVGLGIAGCLFNGCQTSPSRATMGTGIGAASGAVIGQALGHDTTSTLIGAGVGALVGGVAGNEMDKAKTQEEFERQRQEIQRLRQQQMQQQMQQQQQRQPVYGAPPSTQPQVQGGQPPLEAPAGHWITVDGHWQGGQWIPAHRVWVPTNP